MFIKGIIFSLRPKPPLCGKTRGFSQYGIRKLQKLGASFAFCTTTWANRVVKASGTRTRELEIFFF